MRAVAPDIKRGRLTDEEKAEIERLAGSLAKPTPGRIATRLNRHPATINWFMLSHGLIEREPGRAAVPYKRGGQTIYPYAPEHDARLLELLLQEEPKPPTPTAARRAVAALLTAEFGIPRNEHSVRVRVTQLAAAP